LVSYAAGACLVFANKEDLADKNLEYGLFILAAQTTQDRKRFKSIQEELEQVFAGRLTVLDTICDATRQRQEEALRLASEVDAMVVVGGRESGNTRRLAHIASTCKVPTVLVETADELAPGFFAGARRVGLIAGASTPENLTNAVEDRLLRM
jgi:4-hydroxy-3-methylbut-2-enyl diphosphate reductase